MENIVLKIKLLLMLVVGILFNSCLREDDLKLPFKSFQPVDLQDGWEISTPSAEQIDPDRLNAIYKNYHENKDLWQVRSLLVFRNDKLIAESYTKDAADITNRVAIWSCTKQITAILTGIAIDKGLIGSVNDNLQKYLPEKTAKYPDKANITIENLLKMQSGIKFENDGFNGESNKLLKEIPDNSLDFVLGLPVFSEQGKIFHYNDGDPHLISAVIQQQTGQTMRDWAKNVLFSKINLTNYEWLTHKDGITMGAFGILTTPREMAKIGNLVMHNGNWQGEQVVSSVWIAQMTQARISPEVTNYYLSFGYDWWIGESRGIIAMCGHGGQFVFVKPSKNLVVVTTAEPNTQGKHEFLIQKALAIFDEIDSISY
jgi:CubicO group peptidase (beta-lactamase class C family)